MPTRNVVLSNQQEELVRELVSTGKYQNASEVLRDGLRLLEDKLHKREAELADIKAGIYTGLDQIERGDFAQGTGEQAIERAFMRAKKKRGL